MEGNVTTKVVDEMLQQVFGNSRQVSSFKKNKVLLKSY